MFSCLQNWFRRADLSPFRNNCITEIVISQCSECLPNGNFWLSINGVCVTIRNKSSTRQHSSRIHTAHLQTIPASVSVATTRCCSQRWGRSTNEQVWTGLQWSPPDVTNRGRGRSPGLMSGVGRGGLWRGRSPGLMSGEEGTYHVTYHVTYVTSPTPWTDRHLWRHYLSQNSFPPLIIRIWSFLITLFACTILVLHYQTSHIITTIGWTWEYHIFLCHKTVHFTGNPLPLVRRQILTRLLNHSVWVNDRWRFKVPAVTWDTWTNDEHDWRKVDLYRKRMETFWSETVE